MVVSSVLCSGVQSGRLSGHFPYVAGWGQLENEPDDEAAQSPNEFGGAALC